MSRPINENVQLILTEFKVVMAHIQGEDVDLALCLEQLDAVEQHLAAIREYCHERLDECPDCEGHDGCPTLPVNTASAVLPIASVATVPA